MKSGWNLHMKTTPVFLLPKHMHARQLPIINENKQLFAVCIPLVHALLKRMASGSHFNHSHFLFLATAESLAEQVEQEHFDKGLIYPPFSNIRKISAHIAAKVAAKAYELGELFFFFSFDTLL